MRGNGVPRVTTWPGSTAGVVAAPAAYALARRAFPSVRQALPGSHSVGLARPAGNWLDAWRLDVGALRVARAQARHCHLVGGEKEPRPGVGIKRRL